jgi:hypothetical protein
MRNFLLALCLATANAAAQGSLEIIPLRYRTVEQVLPVLRPLLEPGGTLTGQANQLIVRTSPRNLEELRSALEAIDTPARRLQISVRFDNAVDASRIGASRFDLSERDRIDQRIQVLEGGRAVIAAGQSRPLPVRQIVQTPRGPVVTETTVIQDIETGFEVVPRLSGQTVFLEIAPQRETPGALPGSVRAQGAATSLSARLGEWVEIGGIDQDLARDTQGFATGRQARGMESRRIWVKVEEIGR